MSILSTSCASRCFDLRNPRSLLAALSFFLLVASSIPATAASFRASAAKMDITPEEPQWHVAYAARKSTGINDRLYHRIVAMDDGQTQLFLISSDLTVIPPSYYQDTISRVKRQVGIEERQIWWTATHTHSAPAVGSSGFDKLVRPWRKPHPPNTEYSEWVQRQLIDGLRKARSLLEPARLGITTGTSLANINRRAVDEDGKVSLGSNPDRPVDRQIGLIRLARIDGSVLALVANYAMHCTVLGAGNSLISGDAAGVVAEYVETQVRAPMLFINGAAGNVAPIYSDHSNPRAGHLSQFKTLLGDPILAAHRSLRRTTPNIRLWMGKTIIETPQKTGFGWLDDAPDYVRTDGSGKSWMRIPVRFLKINDSALIWSAPVELFNQIATAVRQGSPYPNTLYFGYANGYIGYLPIKTAFAEGGYEPGLVCPFTDQVEDDFKKGVLDYIRSKIPN